MARLFSYVLLFLLVTATAPVWAYSNPVNGYTLEVKGFSPEMVTSVEHMVNRMEGRYPKPEPTRWQKGWYNFLNNTWMDPLEYFPNDVLDPPRFPRDEVF